jgi:hypothetical protein
MMCFCDFFVCPDLNDVNGFDRVDFELAQVRRAQSACVVL